MIRLISLIAAITVTLSFISCGDQSGNAVEKINDEIHTIIVNIESTSESVYSDGDTDLMPQLIEYIDLLKNKYDHKMTVLNNELSSVGDKLRSSETEGKDELRAERSRLEDDISDLKYKLMKLHTVKKYLEPKSNPDKADYIHENVVKLDDSIE